MTLLNRLFFIFCFVSIVTFEAQAQITLTIDTFNTDELSFSVSGTVDAGSPSSYRNSLFLADADLVTNKSWLLDNAGNMVASPIITTGIWNSVSRTIKASAQNDAGVNPFSDYVEMWDTDTFSDLSGGGGLNFSFSITGASLFDPSEIDNFALVWGSTMGQPYGTPGSVLATVAVPEVSTYALAFSLGAFFYVLKRQRKKNKL